MPTSMTFETWDVFTQSPFTGNPLAVVRGAPASDGALLQRIAREFNLSETIFILPPSRAEALVDVRIFTPHRELPFAGHPTVGVSMSLAAAGAVNPGSDGTAHFILNEKVGPVPVTVAFAADGRTPTFAVFTTAVAPGPVAGDPVPAEAWADILGLDQGSVLAEAVGVWSAGVPFPIVPLTDRDALANARLGSLPTDAFPSGGDVDSVYLITTGPDGALGPVEAPGLVDARLFAPGHGIPEDPATGSAAAALAGWLAARAPADGHYGCRVIQGEDMGRRSEILLTLEVSEGQAIRTQVGGSAVPILQGQFAS